MRLPPIEPPLTTEDLWDICRFGGISQGYGGTMLISPKAHRAILERRGIEVPPEPELPPRTAEEEEAFIAEFCAGLRSGTKENPHPTEAK